MLLRIGLISMMFCTRKRNFLKAREYTRLTTVLTRTMHAQAKQCSNTRHKYID